MTNKKRTLPDGYYEIVILGVEVKQNKNHNGRHIKIGYEIISPKRFAFHFDKDYKNQNTENQKWNGFIYISIGKSNHSKPVQKFEEFIRSMEASDPNYKYDRKTESMKGIRLGAYIVNKPYIRTNGSKCNTIIVNKFCSLEKYELEQCDNGLPLLTEDVQVEKS